MFTNNRIVKLLKVKYPIVQGAMAWVADADLAAAVSNGGGLGVVAAGNMPPEMLDRELSRVRELTDKPFALNIMLLSPTWKNAMDLAAAHMVPVVTTGAGLPGKIIDRLAPLRITVIPVVASIAYAERARKQGAKAVIAEGMEAGGHIGEITTMALTAQISSAVDIPVIAAGGIADGRGMLAAFALGAEGIQMGTRFVCASECNAHERFKNRIIAANDHSTVVTGRALGHPVRSIKNKFTQAFMEMEENKAEIAKLDEFGSGKLRAAVVDGDVENGSVMSGQIAGLVKKIQPAREIVEEIVNEAAELSRTIGARFE
jgi:enoyl-[acyl-carrier protein] reductase II